MGCGPSKVVTDCRSHEKWNVLLSQLQQQADTNSLLLTTNHRPRTISKNNSNNTSINSGGAVNRNSVCLSTSSRERESDGFVETINIVDLMDGLLHEYDGEQKKKACPTSQSDPDTSNRIDEPPFVDQRSLSREHNLSFGRFCHSQRFESLPPSIETSINIRSKDDLDQPTINNSINFALRALSFRFLLDEDEASLKLFNKPAADISPSLPPNPDFCTTNSANLMCHSADPDLSISEESCNPLTMKKSPFFNFNKDKLVQINSPLQDDDMPFFDPDLLESLEMALQHSTAEEWNAERKTDQELQQYDIG